MVDTYFTSDRVEQTGLDSIEVETNLCQHETSIMVLNAPVAFSKKSQYNIIRIINRLR